MTSNDHMRAAIAHWRQGSPDSHERTTAMTDDQRAEVLNTPTTDPGIVAAIVYLADCIAANGAGSDKTGPRSDQQAEGGYLGGGGSERHTGPHLTIPAGTAVADRETMIREFLEREGTR